MTPRCLKDVKFSKLEVEYDSSANEWMTSKIFSKWLSGINYEFSLNNRKIALLINCAPSHQTNGSLSHIDVIFLQKKTLVL